MKFAEGTGVERRADDGLLERYEIAVLLVLSGFPVDRKHLCPERDAAG